MTSLPQHFQGAEDRSVRSGGADEKVEGNGCACRFCTRDRRFKAAMEGAADPAFLLATFEAFNEMEYEFDRQKLFWGARDAE